MTLTRDQQLYEDLNVLEDILCNVLLHLEGELPNAREGLITEIKAYTAERLARRDATPAQLAVDATRQELADRLEKYARDVSNSNHGGDQHTCDCDEAARLLRANTAQSADWRPMSSAPKDHSSILLLLKNPLPEQRNDLKHWIGLQFVGRHPGVCEDGFDIGWSFAAPVGHGGFPDDWFVGWMPLPASTQIGSQEVHRGCICQDQHRRGHCTEPGCPYKID